MTTTKHNILAVVIPVLLMTGTVDAIEIYNKNGNKLNFYGKVVGEHSSTPFGVQEKIYSSYNQIGFKGETQINDQVVGYSQLEYYQTKSSKIENNQDRGMIRLALAGIKINDIGSLDYGHGYDIMHDVESYTNKSPSFSGENWKNRYADNKYMNNRYVSLLTYRNSNFFGLVDGLSLGVQYQGKNEGINLIQTNGDGIGISLKYETNEGLGLIGAYTSSNRTEGQKTDGKGDKAEYWAVGAKYDIDNIYLATIYAETRNVSILGNSSNTITPDADSNIYDVAEKTQNFELTAQYQFDCGLRPSISYVQSKSKDLNNINNRDLVKYVATSATYFFNENFNIYGDYRFNLLNKEDEAVSWINSDNQATIGVTYQF